jgi:hypothetical protein
MKKYIEFLESTDVYQLDNTIGGINFYKFKDYFRVSFTLECKPNHLQRLINLGVKFDFSDKKVGFAYNQKTVGCSGNTLAIKCNCSLEVFKTVYSLFRGEFRPSMLNDTQLQWAGFVPKYRKLKVQPSHSVTNWQRTKKDDLKDIIKQNVHKRKYCKEVFNFPIIQRVLNRV